MDNYQTQTPSPATGRKASLYARGSICLSDIPKEVLKAANNGKIYLNFAVMELTEPSKYGDTHFSSCAPKKEEQVEGQNYIIGNLKKWEQKEPSRPSYEQIEQAPPISQEQASDLPF